MWRHTQQIGKKTVELAYNTRQDEEKGKQEKKDGYQKKKKEKHQKLLRIEIGRESEKCRDPKEMSFNSTILTKFYTSLSKQRETERQKNRQTDRQTDRQTYRHTDRQTDRQTEMSYQILGHGSHFEP